MFQGSDTDALQKAGQECAEGAKITDEIIMVVKLLIMVLLAASWFTGGASATYAQVLQTKVLPWLQKISAALHMFAQVLAGQADAQDKVSAGESVNLAALPTYTSPWSSGSATGTTTPAVTPSGATPTIAATPSTAGTIPGTTGGTVTTGAAGALVAGSAGSTGALGSPTGLGGSTAGGSLLGGSLLGGSLAGGSLAGGTLTGGSLGSTATTGGLLGSSGIGSGAGSLGAAGSLGSGLGSTGSALGAGTSPGGGSAGGTGAGSLGSPGGGTGVGDTSALGTTSGPNGSLPTGTGDASATSFRTDTSSLGAGTTPGLATGGTEGAGSAGSAGSTSGLAGSLGAAGAAGALGLGGAAALAGRGNQGGGGLTSPDGFDYNRIKGVDGNANVTPEFVRKVEGIATNLGTKPEYLMAAMSFESGGSFSASMPNAAGSGATGLIQFMPKTAVGLGTTTAALAQMTPVQQLDYVEKYFAGREGKVGTIESLYSTVLYGHPETNPDKVFFSEGTKAYTQNRGLDADHNGQITLSEAAAQIRNRIRPAPAP